MIKTTARIARTSANGGFQIEGETAWYNLSKLGPALQKGPPSTGSLVEMEWEEWNGRPWVKDWEYRAEPSNDQGWQKDLSQAEDGPSAWLRDDRPVVTRLACLNAAVRTMTGKEVDEAVILGLAERYVAWATWGGGNQWQPEEQIDPENLPWETEGEDGSMPGPEMSTPVGPPLSTSPTPASTQKAPFGVRPTKR